MPRHPRSPFSPLARPNPETNIERVMRHALLVKGVVHTAQGRIGRYRPDFIVPALRVVIECDGPVHDTPFQKRKDARKDAYYRACGYRVYRFNSPTILSSSIACVDHILRESSCKPSS